MTAQLKNIVRPVVAPALNWWRHRKYSRLFHRALQDAEKRFGSRVKSYPHVNISGPDEQIWQELGKLNAKLLSVPVSDLPPREFWNKFESLYRGIGFAREKALEHWLTFGLFDLKSVRRYCDVASALSPIEIEFKTDFPEVEFWKQDLLYRTDRQKRVIGGFAQSMDGIENGFFDLMGLHCSFEHFRGSADIDFLREADRLLSPRGACLILPLYLDSTEKIFFDPTCVGPDELAGFDPEAPLCAAFNYRQDHGRYYSPRTLMQRIVRNMPAGLELTLLRFERAPKDETEIYLRFGLVLHRSDSIFRARL